MCVLKCVRKTTESDYCLRYVCLSICPPVCLSMDMEKLGGFSWNLIFEFFFENLSRKFKFYKIRINITATVPEDVFTFFISRSVFLRMKSIGNKICCKSYQNTFYVFSSRFLTLQMGPDRSYRNVGKKLPLLCCVITQKSTVPLYFVA
jgi:hypothetical protein